MTSPLPSMPVWLALESATPVTSVALFRGEQLVGSMEYAGDNLHSRLLTGMIETLFRDLELERKALQCVCVASGPGSYTGLRVGVSAAKGLSFALGIPLYSLGSLDALAWQVREIARLTGSLICPMIDARRMEVYCQLFDADINPVSHPEAKVLGETAFAEVLKERKIIFVGSGAAKTVSLFAGQPNAWVMPEVVSTARSMGRPVWHKIQASQAEDLVTFEPFYLKDFVASVSKKSWVVPPQQ